MAQEDSLRVHYFKKFDDNITTRLSLNNTSNSFAINDVLNSKTYNFIPNDHQRLDFAVNYRAISFSFGYAPDFFAENKDNNNSKSFNLNFRIFHKQWTQSLELYSQKGFYLESDQQRVVLENVKTLKIGGQTSYIFNKNFSFRSIASQAEWQQKSAGSFIPTLSLYYTELQFKIEDYNDPGYVCTIALSPSYFYNLVVLKNFFLSLGASPGFGIQYLNSDPSSLYQIELTASLGYNSDTFFTGINSNSKYFTSNTGSNILWDDSVLRAEIYIGYRFKPPKKLTEVTEKVNQKLHLKNKQ